MALHKNFPKNPYEILVPEIRWFPADEDVRQKGYGKLLPPLVDKIRKEVKKFRDSNYQGASTTSKALLKHWFQSRHPIEEDGVTKLFRYYFAQQEAVETVIWLYEVAGAKDKYDLIRYDSSESVSAGMFIEDWLRLVIKMATGTGKTKVLSLLIAWSYFHKKYEGSNLARNFLLITPNIIVLDRIKLDFDGLKIFHQDPVLPENGYEGQNWRDDFQINVHIQDNVSAVRKIGNIFLTNIQRIYSSKEKIPSFEDENTMDYFLGEKPVVKTTDTKTNLGEIIRDIDELVILNDEAHHIHDDKLAWFKAVEDINNNMKSNGKHLSLQIDVTATPRDNSGGIFVQTVSDYPLVEAIAQNVVKHPVLPDQASRTKLQEHQSSRFTEKYKDYIYLGFLEWQKTYDELKNTKKSILFIMTDDTKNCDEVSEYLQNTYPKLENAVLTIHTKNNGELFETATGKKEKELEKLRKASREIDTWDSPYKAIVSVLMLKEGWDVKNVTTIVGLRAYSAKSNILPEQTLGRGLRKMYRDVGEKLSVIGTPAFMEFVESIKHEGVEIETERMGEGSKPKAPLVIEIDTENVKKDIQKLDIEMPVLTPRICREYKNLSELNLDKLTHNKVKIKQFSKEEQKEIVFKHIDSDEISHTTKFDTSASLPYQNVIGYFARMIQKEMKLVRGFDIIYEKLKAFIMNYLFTKKVILEDLNILRNLSELEVSKTIIETFKKEINNLTVVNKGETEIRDYIKLSKCRPFVVQDQAFTTPKKSVFNKIIGDSHFELEFAEFLEKCNDIISYAKNFSQINFKIDYINSSGEIKNYYPDFFVKVAEKEIYIIETKGLENLDDKNKFTRLCQWCKDVNQAQNKIKCKALYVKQDNFEKYNPSKFSELKGICR